MPQHQQLHVLRAAAASKLGQHLQNLTQQQVGQRSRHALHRHGYMPWTAHKAARHSRDLLVTLVVGFRC